MSGEVNIPVEVSDQFGQRTTGLARVMTHTPRAAFWIGAKKSARLVGILFLAMLPFGFLEPFLFLIWGTIATLFLVLVAGPVLHMHYSNETSTFTRVDAQCLTSTPPCSGKSLHPFLSKRFDREFKVLCPTCGQTFLARPLSEYLPGKT